MRLPQSKNKHKQTYQLGFYDSLIVAAALHARCKRLLSEDLQHGQNIEGLVITNPFL
jgi:predicted nucleic acid-binding protein